MSEKGTILGIITVAIIVSVAAFIGAMKAGDANERQVRDLCRKLDAEFVEDPRWMCIRDNEIVYGGNN